MTLFLEDLTPGRRFASDARVLPPEQVTAFAAEYDPQPFHLDDAAARASLFGERVASGWHTAAFTMRLLVETLPVAGGVIGSGVEVTWPQPTRPGDTLRLDIEVLDARPSASRPRGRVRLHVVTRNQHDAAVQIMVAELVVPARQA